MKVNTRAYGEVEVDERQRVNFPGGLLGFEKFTDYVLMDARQKPFIYLQSLEVPELAFILIDPFLFRPDYALDMSDEVLEDIGVEAPADAVIFSIVTAPADGTAITANLMGPVIISKSSRKGMQAVLADPRWRVKHDIMAEMAAARK